MIAIQLARTVAQVGLTRAFARPVLNLACLRRMSSGTNGSQDDIIPVTFVKPDGTKLTVKGKEGKSLYDIVIDNNLDIDGFGACEGTLCCTTCHLIFNQSDYSKYGEPDDEELDMLDLAYGLTDTSRLGCQVMLKKANGPLEVHIPKGVSDVRADD